MQVYTFVFTQATSRCRLAVAIAFRNGQQRCCDLLGMTLGLASLELNKETWHSFQSSIVDDPTSIDDQNFLTTMQMTPPAVKETGNFHFIDSHNAHCCSVDKASSSERKDHSISLTILRRELAHD
jgi:hypothetical protein